MNKNTAEQLSAKMETAPEQDAVTGLPQEGCEPKGSPAVFLVTADVNLTIELHRLAAEVGYCLRFPDMKRDELFVYSAKVRIVNRRMLEKSCWQFYRELLVELFRPYAAEERQAMAECEVEFGEAIFVEPPLILTDGFSQAEEEAWGLLPEVGLEVYRIEEGLHEVIVAKVREIVGRGRK